MSILLSIYCFFIGLLFGGTSIYAFNSTPTNQHNKVAFEIVGWFFACVAIISVFWGVYVLIHPIV